MEIASQILDEGRSVVLFSAFLETAKQAPILKPCRTVLYQPCAGIRSAALALPRYAALYRCYAAVLAALDSLCITRIHPEYAEVCRVDSRYRSIPKLLTLRKQQMLTAALGGRWCGC